MERAGHCKSHAFFVRWVHKETYGMIGPSYPGDHIMGSGWCPLGDWPAVERWQRKEREAWLSSLPEVVVVLSSQCLFGPHHF